NNRLMIASPRAVDLALLERSLGELQAAVDRRDRERAGALLRHIVPEYARASSAEAADASPTRTADI
ncbi:MAG: hypothetical protein KDJ77_09600, partial [Rhodobiaceae bacterium]|nr:hypothetical protein [Rhodobiaceae bacterium]